MENGTTSVRSTRKTASRGARREETLESQPCLSQKESVACFFEGNLGEKPLSRDWAYLSMSRVYGNTPFTPTNASHCLEEGPRWRKKRICIFAGKLREKG